MHKGKECTGILLRIKAQNRTLEAVSDTLSFSQLFLKDMLHNLFTNVIKTNLQLSLQKVIINSTVKCGKYLICLFVGNLKT